MWCFVLMPHRPGRVGGRTVPWLCHTLTHSLFQGSRRSMRCLLVPALSCIAPHTLWLVLQRAAFMNHRAYVYLMHSWCRLWLAWCWISSSRPWAHYELHVHSRYSVSPWFRKIVCLRPWSCIWPWQVLFLLLCRWCTLYIYFGFWAQLSKWWHWHGWVSDHPPGCNPYYTDVRAFIHHCVLPWCLLMLW